ncbi:hypothetical protein [Modestobacter sp. I12A-02662]
MTVHPDDPAAMLVTLPGVMCWWTTPGGGARRNGDRTTSAGRV